MNFTEVVRSRRMVRNFLDTPVPNETLLRILDLARRGPSAGFTQGQDFIVITDPMTKQAIAGFCSESSYVEQGFAAFISHAPVLIIPCTSEVAYIRRYREPDKMADENAKPNWPVPFWFMDIGCAVMIILLAVVNEGLVAGFAGLWDVAGCRRLLGIPDEVIPVGVIPIGYAAPDKRSPSLKRGRRPDNEVIHHERW